MPLCGTLHKKAKEAVVMTTLSSHRTHFIIALLSVVLHILILFFFTMHHLSFLPAPAHLIFADPTKKNKALDTPPQQKAPPSTSWAARTERQYAFDPSQIKTVGLAYAPPHTLANDSSCPSDTTPVDSEPVQPAPVPLLPQEHLAVPDMPSRAESDAKKHKTESTLDNKQAVDVTLPRSQQTTPNKPVSPTVQQKKSSLTLAQLTSGFIAHMANKPGDSAVSTRGDKNKKPTAEQLIFERYQEKTYHCLLQSNNRYNNRYPDIAKYQTLELQILVTYHANGLAHNISLLSPSGHREFDDYCMFIFTDASSSFPPVPPSFLRAQNNYSIPFTILSSPHDNNWLKVRR